VEEVDEGRGMSRRREGKDNSSTVDSKLYQKL
jgi:hypothetical protein